MVVTGCQENGSCNKVLNFLERLDDKVRCTHEETTAVVLALKRSIKTVYGGLSALSWLPSAATRQKGKRGTIPNAALSPLQ